MNIVVWRGCSALRDAVWRPAYAEDLRACRLTTRAHGPWTGARSACSFLISRRRAAGLQWRGVCTIGCQHVRTQDTCGSCPGDCIFVCKLACVRASVCSCAVGVILARRGCVRSRALLAQCASCIPVLDATTLAPFVSSVVWHSVDQGVLSNGCARFGW